ncbi:MAG: periplasmic heavy metal sensor [Candidatus Latescibacteria bacterium]|nr:periplasmic heavy metal sensor [Candidatus Latescibacterota bacterium]
MRTKIGLAIAALFVIGIAATAFAQPMRGGGRMPHAAGPKAEKGRMGVTPPLTTEQTEKISALRIDHQKGTIDLRADLQKKQLDLRTLMLPAKPNEQKIHAVIEEMGALKTQLRKQRVSHGLKVRELLTPEQRASRKALGFGLDGRHGKRHPRHGQGQDLGWDMGPRWE